MKQEDIKKLKWVKPCLESLGKSELTSGSCLSGNAPTAGPECTNGGVAANSCSGGTTVLAL